MSSQVSFLSILNSFVAGPLYRAFKKQCGLDCASGVAPVVAHVMADRQIFQMATSTFAQRFDVLQGSGIWQHMLTTDPARHHAMHLPSDRFVDLVTRVGKFAHSRQCSSHHPQSQEQTPN